MESNFWYVNDAWLESLDEKLEKDLLKKAEKGKKKKITKTVATSPKKTLKKNMSKA